MSVQSASLSFPRNACPHVGVGQAFRGNDSVDKALFTQELGRNIASYAVLPKKLSEKGVLQERNRVFSLVAYCSC